MSASSSSVNFETSCPSKKYVPEVGLSNAPKICIKVDFPEPDGPIIATNSPSAIVKVIPLNAWNSISPVLYVFVIFFISIILSTNSNCSTTSCSASSVAQDARCSNSGRFSCGGYCSRDNLISLFQSGQYFRGSCVRNSNFYGLISGWNKRWRTLYAGYRSGQSCIKHLHITHSSSSFHCTIWHGQNILLYFCDDFCVHAHSRFYSAVSSIKTYFYAVIYNSLRSSTQRINLYNLTRNT